MSNIAGGWATQQESNCLFPSSGVNRFQNNLNVSHVNINSITAPSRLDELEQFANSNDIHVLCITETKIDERVGQSLYTMKSFSPPFTKNRTRRGGGVAIYTRSNLACTRICELELEDVEWIWIKLRQKGRQLSYVVYTSLPIKVSRNSKTSWTNSQIVSHMHTHIFRR